MSGRDSINSTKMGTRNASILAPSRTWSRFTELPQEAPPCMSWIRRTYNRSNSVLRMTPVSRAASA